MEDQYFTVREVSERLKVTGRTVREWIKTGRLKALRAGHAWRIGEQDLREFLRRQHPEPPEGRDGGAS